MIALLAVLAVVSVPATAQSAFPGANGKIVFSSDRDGNYQIYVMEPGGTNQTRLTNNTADEFFPVWSANGSKIAFTTDRDGDGHDQIYTMNANGSGQTRLTNDPAQDSEPGWAPDGSKLVFVSNRSAAPGLELWRVNANGTGLVQLTSTGGFNVDPVWSPDGSKIAFMSDRDGDWEIYVIDALNGGNPTRLTTNAANDYGPAWSPDGSKLAFISQRDAGNDEIYVMQANGQGQTRLTSDAGTDTSPAWSADGTKIVFNSDRDGDREIFVMSPDGQGQTALTTNAAQDRLPDWQPLVSGGGGDTTAPVLTLPADQTVNATSPAGAAVTFAASATDDTDPAPTVTCTPPSGATFAIGGTAVSCSATDTSGNSSNGTFNVTVFGANGQIAALLSKLFAAGVPPALSNLLANFDPSNPRQRQVVCAGLRAFTVVVGAQSGRRGVPAAEAAQWIADANRIRAVLGC